MLAALLFVTGQARADSFLGFKAGASTAPTDGLAGKPGLALGGALSVTGWSPLPGLTIAPQLELVLASHNASVALGGTENLSYSMDSIELPLLLHTELTLGSRSFYALTGAYAGILLRAQRATTAGTIDHADTASSVDIGLLAAGGLELASTGWGDLFVELRYQRGFRALLPGSDRHQQALTLLLGIGLGAVSSDSISPYQDPRLALKSGPIATRFRSSESATAMYSPGASFGGAYSPIRFGSWIALVPQLELAFVHRGGNDEGSTDGSLALDYLDLSMLVRGEIPAGGGAVYGLGGLYGSALLRAQRTHDEVITDARGTISAIDAGWIAGAGIELAATANAMVSVELRYQRGRRDLVPDSPGYITQHSVSCLFGITYGRRSPDPSQATDDTPPSETDRRGAIDTVDALQTKLTRLLAAMEASSSASQWNRPGSSRCRSRAATPFSPGVLAMPDECSPDDTQQETGDALHTVLLALTRDTSAIIERLKGIARDVSWAEQDWLRLNNRILVPTLEHAEWIVDELQSAQELLTSPHQSWNDQSFLQRIGHHYEAALLGAQVLSLWASWLDFARSLWLGTTLDKEWIITRLWNAWKEIDPLIVQLQAFHMPRFQRAAEALQHKLPEWSDALYRWGKEAETRARETADLVQKLLLVQAVFDIGTMRQVIGPFAGRAGAYAFILPGIGGITASGAATGIRVVISAEWIAAIRHLIAIGAITTAEIARIAGISSIAMSPGPRTPPPAVTGGRQNPSPGQGTASGTAAQADGRSTSVTKPANGSAASSTVTSAARGAAGAINVTEKGLGHVLARHVAGGAQTAGKSLFSGGAKDVQALIRAAERVAPTLQKGGNFQRVVDAGRAIGVDRATGAPTSIYTVITNKAGELVTAFPGIP